MACIPAQPPTALTCTCKDHQNSHNTPQILFRTLQVYIHVQHKSEHEQEVTGSCISLNCVQLAGALHFSR